MAVKCPASVLQMLSKSNKQAYIENQLLFKSHKVTQKPFMKYRLKKNEPAIYFTSLPLAS